MRSSLIVLLLLSCPAFAQGNPCAGKATQGEFRSCIDAQQRAKDAQRNQDLKVPSDPVPLGPTGAPPDTPLPPKAPNDR